MQQANVDVEVGILKRYSGHVVFAILAIISIVLFVRIATTFFYIGLWQTIKIWKTDILFFVFIGFTLKIWKKCWKKWVPDDPKRHIGIMNIHGGRRTNTLLKEGKSFLPAILWIDAGAITVDATMQNVDFTVDKIPTEVENPLKPDEILKGFLKLKLSLSFRVDESDISRVKRFIDIGRAKGLPDFAKDKIQSFSAEVCGGKRLEKVAERREVISDEILVKLLGLKKSEVNEDIKANGIPDRFNWGIVIHDIIMKEVDGSGPLAGILSLGAVETMKATADMVQTEATVANINALKKGTGMTPDKAAEHYAAQEKQMQVIIHRFSGDSNVGDITKAASVLGSGGGFAGATAQRPSPVDEDRLDVTGADSEEADEESGHGWTQAELDQFNQPDENEQ